MAPDLKTGFFWRHPNADRTYGPAVIYLGLTSSTSKVIFTSLPAINEPSWSLLAQETPKSCRLIVVVAVKPELITLWKYEQGRPLRDFLYPLEKKAVLEYYL